MRPRRLAVVALAVAAVAAIAWLSTRRPGAPDADAAASSYDANGRPADGVRPRARPHVLLVCLEGVRADSIAPTPGKAPGMPTLVRLAARGLRFPEAVSPSARGAASAASLLTGLTPREHQAAAGTLSEFWPTLPEILAAAGYRTGAWVGPSVGDRVRGLRQGFSKFELLPSLGSTGGAIEAWVGESPSTPTFLLLHAKVTVDPVPLAPDGGADETRTQSARFAYERAVGQLDALVADLVLRIERTFSSPPVVFLTSSNGRAILEHGFLGTGGALFDEHVRVPLAIWGPGVPAGERAGACSLVDVLPTVLGLLGMPGAGGPGVSLLAPAGLPADRIVEAQEYVRLRSARGPGNHVLWSLRSSRAKYVADFDTGTTEGTESLFDLASDPGETKSLPLDQVGRFGPAFAAAVEDVRAEFRGKRKLADDLALLGYPGGAGADFPPPEDAEPLLPR
jgi:arylsulfatase A-like enzyme